MSGFSVYGNALGRFAVESDIRKIFGRYSAKTMQSGVCAGQQSFCGFYAPLGEDENGPVIVSGTDGVGSKLKLASLMNRHDTIGIDCVALSANDVICSGARPLFFSTYLAMGRRKPELIEEIVKGITEGCLQAECTLIGGETAETPGTYATDEYDLAGFCVGLSEKKTVIDGSAVQEGDALIALPSSGLHSDGFASAMRILRVTDKNIRIYIDDLGRTIGEELIAPSKIYVRPIMKLLETCRPNGIANITGGGLYRNVPGIVPDGMCARLSRARMRIHPIFSVIKSMNNSVDDNEMFGTFNMGIGMLLSVSADKADETVRTLNSCGESAYIVGEIIKGDERMLIE